MVKGGPAHPELWTTLYAPLFGILSFKRYTLRVVEWLARANGQPCDSIFDVLPSFEKAEWVFERLETLELFSSVGSGYGWILDDKQPDLDVVVLPMALFKTATRLRSITIECEWLRIEDRAKIMDPYPQMQQGYFRIASELTPTRSQPKHVLTHLGELRLRVLYCSPSIVESVEVYDC
ncbi:hypothetical protein NLJ89_g9703 [Agrocybe chaxingu]|uniref:Uncharacterized protein n=1 Tax=Agrocybe chaxingu TaxID=84603 RepID=A0A9W8JT27_9AGAR|nr:hypothetical protein NLJ89_g9703 [Agrocybe chaxingu]